MGIYRKERDNDIGNFIEIYGGANTRTISNLYFSNTTNPYINASRRLKVLYDNKALKRYRPSVNEEYVYYVDKPIKTHKLKLLEVYSLISQLGNIKQFDINYKIKQCKREIDGFIELEIEDKEYITTMPLIIEIDYTHNTSLKKLNDIYKSGYFQKQYGFMPRIIIVKRNSYDRKLKSKDMDIYNLYWNLESLNDIIINEII